MPNRLLVSQRIVRICLFLVAAIALSGGALQLWLGQPETTPRLDNVHRFMAGVYFSTGVISLWTALTIRRQGTLVYLLAYPSKEAREASWKAFGSDPAWVKAKGESEKQGKLVANVTSLFLTSTDYSAIR